MNAKFTDTVANRFDIPGKAIGQSMQSRGDKGFCCFIFKVGFPAAVSIRLFQSIYR